MCTPSLLHLLRALRQSLSHHGQNVELLYFDRVEFKGKRIWPNNGVLEIIEKDVRATLTLPIGPLEVHMAWTYGPKNKYTKLLKRWSRRRNLGRMGTRKVGMMVEQILQRGDCGEMFKRDFILHSSVWRKENRRLMVSHRKHQTTDVLEEKNKDKEMFLREHGKGRAINKIGHQTIIPKAKANLQQELASMG
ncbi:hypothetical protein Cgig2_002760 [Carnegiea gigantea]|uniref:Uncharacterized protein n=1 Tax=Carnegiea gigantea TaxID=171969 RepID=A0A9Q1GV00_9CARY|nr:hypothetical protein Cgig2_002760 [Carnegiea gigantea]